MANPETAVSVSNATNANVPRVDQPDHPGGWTGTLRSQALAARAASRSVEDEFCAILAEAGMCRALALLNARTRYRFTGVYRADPPLLRNEYLFDRENPSLSLGGEISPIDHTYCGIVATTHAPFLAIDAHTDPRLTRHPARDSVVSYVGVPVRQADGHIFGTLCHFDLRPRILPLDELAVLESISRCVSDWLTRSDRLST